LAHELSQTWQVVGRDLQRRRRTTKRNRGELPPRGGQWLSDLPVVRGSGPGDGLYRKRPRRENRSGLLARNCLRTGNGERGNGERGTRGVPRSPFPVPRSSFVVSGPPSR